MDPDRPIQIVMGFESSLRETVEQAVVDGFPCRLIDADTWLIGAPSGLYLVGADGNGDRLNVELVRVVAATRGRLGGTFTFGGDGPGSFTEPETLTAALMRPGPCTLDDVAAIVHGPLPPPSPVVVTQPAEPPPEPAEPDLPVEPDTEQATRIISHEPMPAIPVRTHPPAAPERRTPPIYLYGLRAAVPLVTVLLVVTLAVFR